VGRVNDEALGSGDMRFALRPLEPSCRVEGSTAYQSQGGVETAGVVGVSKCFGEHVEVDANVAGEPPDVVAKSCESRTPVGSVAQSAAGDRNARRPRIGTEGAIRPQRGSDLVLVGPIGVKGEIRDELEALSREAPGASADVDRSEHSHLNLDRGVAGFCRVVRQDWDRPGVGAVWEQRRLAVRELGHRGRDSVACAPVCGVERHVYVAEERNPHLVVLTAEAELGVRYRSENDVGAAGVDPRRIEHLRRGGRRPAGSDDHDERARTASFSAPSAIRERGAPVAARVRRASRPVDVEQSLASVAGRWSQLQVERPRRSAPTELAEQVTRETFDT
jgi:hypothetical protein